jgi:fibronectin-binding autotransporter adhesin
MKSNLHCLFRFSTLSAIVLTLPLTITARLSAQTTYYLDVNGITEGSGIAEAGSYNVGTSIWSLSADGTGASVAHVNNNPYVIASGGDAQGRSFTLSGTLQQPSNLTVEEGFVTMSSTLDTFRSPTIQTNDGTSLAISSPNLRATARFNTLGTSSVDLFRIANNNGVATTFIKNGPGSLIINNNAANIRPSFVSTINNGNVRIRSGNAFYLADSRLTLISLTINAGGSLELDNNITVANNPVTIHGPGFNNGSADLGAIANFGGNNNYNSRITLGSASRINNNAPGTNLTLNPDGPVAVSGGHSLTLGGVGAVTVSKSIESISSLAKDGPGTLTLAGNNTYQGATTIGAGTVIAGGPSPFGVSNANVTLQAGATLDLAGQELTAGKAFSLAGGSLLNSTDSSTLETAASATLLTGGSYAPNSFPEVAIGGPGSGAILDPLLRLENTAVTGLVGGSGYSITATATFTPAPSGGTTATATLSFGLTQASINSISGGTGWAVNDVISINGPTGSVPAQATVSSVNAVTGAITGITLTSSGSGYVAAPTAITKVTSAAGVTTGVTLSANATNFTVAAVNVTSLGGGYFTAPTLSISAPNVGGAQATAVAPNSTVHALSFFNGGSGYTTAPAITFSGGIVNATATGGTASIGLSADSIIGGNGDLLIKPGISSSGAYGITKTGTGTLTLAGSSTYTGQTTVLDGTLVITIPGFSPSSTLTIGSAAASPAILNLPNADTHIVAALVIDGVPMAAGKYSEASANSGGAITGLGEIEVVSPISGYQSFIATAGLQNPWLGIDATLNGEPGADPDGDGIPNLIEYAIAGGNPALPNATTGTFTGNTLTVTKRDPLPNDLSYIIETSTDLGIADDWAPAVTHNPPHASNTISHTLTSGPGKDFMRLKVVQSAP